jgi:hypothetical protein
VGSDLAALYGKSPGCLASTILSPAGSSNCGPSACHFRQRDAFPLPLPDHAALELRDTANESEQETRHWCVFSRKGQATGNLGCSVPRAAFCRIPLHSRFALLLLTNALLAAALLARQLGQIDALIALQNTSVVLYELPLPFGECVTPNIPE